jgi:hypothetical protein
MLKNTIFNSINKRTLYFNVKFLQIKRDAFYLIKLLDFKWEITLLKNASSNNPITLFIIYYTLKIINIIVERINKYIRELKDDSLPYARAN